MAIWDGCCCSGWVEGGREREGVEWVGGLDCWFFRGGGRKREGLCGALSPRRLFVYRVALVEMQTFCIVVVGGPVRGWLWVVLGWWSGCLWRRLCGCKMPRNGTAVHAHVYKHKHTHTHKAESEQEREEHAKTDTYTKQDKGGVVGLV